jgi:hypothetical protein
MGFFKKFKKIALPIVGAIAGSALPGVGTALGASIGSSLGTLASGQGLQNALLAGAGNYVGASIGGSLFPQTLGQSLPFDAVGGIGGTVADVFGGQAANTLMNTSIGGALGGYYGSSLAQNSFGKQGEPTPQAPAGPDPFKPKREDQKDAPPSISGMGALTPEQQSTGLATQGVYGGGNGPDEQAYFANLINRRLVDESGGVSDMSALKPIERSYLDRIGLGGYGNSMSLLEAMSKWRPA